MRPLLLLLTALLFTGDLAAFEARSMRDCRLAFLLGMSTGRKENTGWEMFWGSEHGARETYEKVARAYATELGASAEELRTDAWRTRVIAALDRIRGTTPRLSESTLEDAFGDLGLKDGMLDLPSAYLAGAYARFGTPQGFQLIEQRKGLYFVVLIRAVSRLQIDVQVRPGIPGNISLTLSGGGKNELEDFFAELKSIRETIER